MAQKKKFKTMKSLVDPNKTNVEVNLKRVGMKRNSMLKMGKRVKIWMLSWRRKARIIHWASLRREPMTRLIK